MLRGTTPPRADAKRWMTWLALSFALACRPTASTPPDDRTAQPESTSRIEGRVVDAAGKPVHGARVVVQGAERGFRTTDAAGGFSISVPRRRVYQVTALSAGESAFASMVVDEPVVRIEARLGAASQGTITFPDSPRMTRIAALLADADAHRPACERGDDWDLDEPQASRARQRQCPRAAYRHHVAALLAEERAPELRALLLLLYFREPSVARGYGDAPADPERAVELLGSLAPDSPWWALSPFAMGNAISETPDPPAWDEYVRRAASTQDDDVAMIVALHQRFVDAWDAGRIDEARGWKAELEHTRSRMRGIFEPDLDKFDAHHGPLRVGGPVPEFAFVTTDGNPLSRESLRGRTYLLYLWTPSCGSCKQDMKPLHDLHERFGDGALDVVTIGIGDAEGVATFRRERGPMPWTHVLVEDSRSPELRPLWRGATPTWVLVGPDGLVRANSLDHPMSVPGRSKLAEYVEPYLAARR